METIQQLLGIMRSERSMCQTILDGKLSLIILLLFVHLERVCVRIRVYYQGLNTGPWAC
jgi:hypothetical protein